MLLLEAWARDGLTDEQIANNIGITAKTLYEWKNKYSEISESLKRGKEIIDIEVENALLKRALGYTFTEVTRERIFNNETGQFELMVTKQVTKQVEPSTTAQIFWLKNRKVEEWRDKKEYTPEPTERVESNLTLEELRSLAKLFNDEDK